MKISIIFFIILGFVGGIDDARELKVTYYENLINSAILKAEQYKLPKDNSAYFENLSQDIKDFGEFDFIIVGAGSSGSVVSTRLSEEESFKILLLEAGGWDDDLTSIPYFSSLLHQSERNWGYYTTPQENGCYGWRGRKCAYQRGKLVGGSGSINSMAYVRGNRGDYDNWAALGNPGWSFDDVLPYFKKLENLESEKIDVEFRGFAGPVNSVINNEEDYFDRLSSQLSEIGFDIIDDYNAKQQIGAARNQFFVRLGWRGRKCAYQRGKLVGGSGSINSMAYVRGNRGDYDNWAALGNPGWSFDDVLPYFKKLENFESEKIDAEFRGFAGPVNSVINNEEDYFDRLSSQLTEIGFDIIDDYNAKQQIGAARNQFFVRLGKRVSGATAYVRPSITRHNFNVTVGAFVTRILINALEKKAYGVEFIRNGQRFTANAKKEVILSAGAINTPQLLMLSGIGPSNELKKHRIPIITDLPVGMQLKDHYMMTLSYQSNATKDHVTLRDAIYDFLDDKGILTRAVNRFAFSFMNTRNESSSIPNIEIAYAHSSPLNLNFPFQSNFTDENSEYKKQLGGTFSIDIFLLHPKSSGTLKLQSKYIRDYPLIDLNILGDVEDMEIYYEAIKFITRIEKTKLAKKDNLRIIKYPLCNEFCFHSKEYWFCYLKYSTQSGLHVSSTAKMAPKTDPFAVVDNKLRVYGIEGLRVVDCSIMPTSISGHNNAAALMIGENAADLVKRDHLI